MQHLNEKSKVTPVTYMAECDTCIKNDNDAYVPNNLANLTINGRTAGTKVFRDIRFIIFCHKM